MIETINIAKDKSHLLVIHKEEVLVEVESTNTETQTTETQTTTNQESIDEVPQSKPVFFLEVIPLAHSQKILFDLDYTNHSINNCRVVKDKEEMEIYEIENLQHQSLNDVENISFKYTEPSAKFIVIVDIESGYQDVENARFPINKSISNIFDETSLSESIAISIDKSNERDHQLIIDLIKVAVKEDETVDDAVDDEAEVVEEEVDAVIDELVGSN